MMKTTESKDRLIVELMDRFIDMQIVTLGSHGSASRSLKREGVEGAFRSVPRHLFVDQYYDFRKKPRLIRVDPKRPTSAQLKRIYSDEALASHRHLSTNTSSTSQPSLMAHMLEELRIKPGMKILEIGAGTGWNAALMGHLVGPKGHVYSIDIQSDVAQRARRHIHRLGSQNVEIITGDGGYGYHKEAPYDRIITTVACPDVSPHWMDQLKEGGALLITLQDVPGQMLCLLVRLCKRKDCLSGKVVSLPIFMTLQGKYGTEVVPPKKAEKQLERIKAGRKMHRELAPWGCWLVNKQWRRQDLLFFAYLEGMPVEPAGQQYVFRSEDSDSVCVTGDEQIEVYGGDESYRAFVEITRKWIGLGAPRRDSYLVEVWPKGVAKRIPKNGWLVEREYSQLIFQLK